MKSLSFRSHSLNGRGRWQGRASSWAAARIRNELCRSGIAVPREPRAGLGGSGRAQPWAGNDRPALQPRPACRSAQAGQPHLPPHCGAPGWHGARSARASRCRGALRPPLAVNRFVALPTPRWAVLASALFPPLHSASLPSLHPWQKCSVRVQLQPERSILLGWC